MNDIKMDEWIKLILTNWVLISFVMFYSIIGGILVGSVTVLITASLLKYLAIETTLLTIYPTMGGVSLFLISIGIVAIFIVSFSRIRYDCRRGVYHFKRRKRL